MVQTDEPSIKVEDYEKKAISRAMDKFNGNMSKAAEEMGMARSTSVQKDSAMGDRDLTLFRIMELTISDLMVLQ